MTEIKLDIKEIRKNLFLLDEGGMSTGYLIAGEKMACLIDTMNGFTDLKKVCQSLTDKPVILKGKTEKDGPYKWFGGEGLYHPFSCPEGKHFQQEDHGICYMKEKVK